MLGDWAGAPSGLPSSKARPRFERAGIYGKHGVPAMLCGGGAGVIGHNPQQCPNRQIGPTGLCSRSQRQDAVLLIGAAHDQLRDRDAVKIAHQPETLIHCLAGRSTVTRQRRPAGVGDDPALGLLMSDHSGQDRQRKIVEDADKISVLMSDNKSYDAKIVGLDQPSDLAAAEQFGIPAALVDDTGPYTMVKKMLKRTNGIL